MWDLVYEDTFGFGEERDPPAVEMSGEDIVEGFFHLWFYVLNETLTIEQGRHVVGFARFMLVITGEDGEKRSLRINAGRYLTRLSELADSGNDDVIRKISGRHMEFFRNGDEQNFWNRFQNDMIPFDAV